MAPGSTKLNKKEGKKAESGQNGITCPYETLKVKISKFPYSYKYRLLTVAELSFIPLCRHVIQLIVSHYSCCLAQRHLLNITLIMMQNLCFAVQGCRGENHRIHFHCTRSEPAEGPSGESVFLPGQTGSNRFPSLMRLSINPPVKAAALFTGGVSSGIRATVRHCSACVIVGAALKTGKAASGTGLEAGIQSHPTRCRHVALPLRKHLPQTL